MWRRREEDCTSRRRRTIRCSAFPGTGTGMIFELACTTANSCIERAAELAFFHADRYRPFSLRILAGTRAFGIRERHIALKRARVRRAHLRLGGLHGNR